MRCRTVLVFANLAGIVPAVLMAQGTKSGGSVVSGKFAVDDGSAPPERVRIELTCNSIPRPKGWSDSKGNFTIQVGVDDPNQAADLTYGGLIDRTGTGPGSVTAPVNIDAVPRDLEGCEISGALVGYRSDVVPLSGHRRLDTPDIGIIVLHRLANVEGLSTSATTGLAPEAARKALESAAEAFKKRDLDETQKELKKAVEIYPRYALAWFDLGRLYESRKHYTEAADAYRHSVEADDKYLYPYERLYILTAHDEQWPQVRELTDKVIRLDPVDFPRAYYFSAIANLNLNDLDTAEKSAREAAKLDVASNPRAGYVLGVILARKQNFPEALGLLRAYLTAVPNSVEVETVKQQIAALEKLIAPE